MIIDAERVARVAADGIAVVRDRRDVTGAPGPLELVGAIVRLIFDTELRAVRSRRRVALRGGVRRGAARDGLVDDAGQTVGADVLGVMRAAVAVREGARRAEVEAVALAPVGVREEARVGVAVADLARPLQPAIHPRERVVLGHRMTPAAEA